MGVKFLRHCPYCDKKVSSDPQAQQAASNRSATVLPPMPSSCHRKAAECSQPSLLLPSRQSH